MVTIFDIPLLMDQICRHLSPRDIRLCLHVCKAWTVAFNPYQWDHVSLLRKSNGSSIVEDLSEAEKQLLVENACWIQSLRVHFSEELLNLPDCIHLRAVSFRDLDDFLDNRDPQNRSRGHWDPLTFEGHWQHWGVFKMLAQNRQLEELEIQYVDECPDFQRLLIQYLESVERGGAPQQPKKNKTGANGKGENAAGISAIPAKTAATATMTTQANKILGEHRRRKKLRKFSLRVPIYLEPPKLVALMDWLPRTLTSLSLRQTNNYSGSRYQEDPEGIDPLQEDVKAHFRIQSYKVYGSSSKMLDTFSIWLIGRSPELRELRLPTLSDCREFAPILFRTLSRTLSQTTHPLDLCLDADYLPLPGEKEAREQNPRTGDYTVWSYPVECTYFNQLTVPLCSLTIDVNTDHPNVFETLAKYSSKTLRELKVMGSQPVGDIDLYYVMEDCAPLRRVHYWIGSPDGKDPYIQGHPED